MKNELQTLRLFSPLFPHLYRRNEWGDYENDPEDLTSEELLEYEDELHALIQKAQLPCEDKHDLAIYLDESLNRKVSSIYPDVEEYSSRHIKSAGGVTEYSLTGLNVTVRNAPLAPSSPQNAQHFEADAVIWLEAPVQFGGKQLPSLRIKLKVQAGYTEVF